MASCQTCNTTILWGGVKENGRRYCSPKCMEKDGFRKIADRIPNSVVAAEANKIIKGMCPECNQINDDVEFRFSYRAVSYIVLTSWRKNPILSCSNCHRKKVLKDTIITLFFGWWGFPFGLIVTPIQIIQNISAAFSSNRPKTKPSSELCSFVRAILAKKIIENSYHQVAQGSRIKNVKKEVTLRKDKPPPIPTRMKRSQAKPNLTSRAP